MASLRSWFSILRWSLIITLILLIILAIAPLIFVRNFAKEEVSSYYVINGSVIIPLCVFGLCVICLYSFVFTLIFGILMTIYLSSQIFYLGGNIGVYLTELGVIACSFTYCAVLKRLENEALYGVWTLFFSWNDISKWFWLSFIKWYLI
jgi:hypothetical protein